MTPPDLDQFAREIALHMETLKSATCPVDGSPLDDAIVYLETFCAVALRVMSKSNPSRIRECARTVEIQHRIDASIQPRGIA